MKDRATLEVCPQHIGIKSFIAHDFPHKIFFYPPKKIRKSPKKTAHICLWIDLLIWSVICGFDPTKPCLRSWSNFLLRFPSLIWPVFREFEARRRGFPLKNTSKKPAPECPARIDRSVQPDRSVRPNQTGVSGLTGVSGPYRPECPAVTPVLTVLPHFSHWLISFVCSCPVCVLETTSKLPHHQLLCSSTPRTTNIIPQHWCQVHHQRRYNLRHLVNPHLPLCVPIP